MGGAGATVAAARDDAEPPFLDFEAPDPSRSPPLAAGLRREAAGRSPADDVGFPDAAALPPLAPALARFDVLAGVRLDFGGVADFDFGFGFAEPLLAEVRAAEREAGFGLASECPSLAAVVAVRPPALRAVRFGPPDLRAERARGEPPVASSASRVDVSAILPVVATVVSEGIGSIQRRRGK